MMLWGGYTTVTDRMSRDYNVIMKVDLVRIGNSRGIRIPKALIDQCQLGDEVELRLERDRLVITPAHVVRAGWRDAFEKATAEETGPGELLIPDSVANDFDREEWQW
jgi:antitoxin MazE